MLNSLMKKIFGDPYIKKLNEYYPYVEKINAIEPEIEKLSDQELKAKTPYFKELLAQGQTLDDILVEAFAVVREVSKRTLGMRHFDVQLIGGIVLHQGKIAEMKTGEGKTLVCPLAAYLNALEEKGVYVVTVNDYLAKRDSEWMGKIYNFLGLSVGLSISGMSPQEKKIAYEADITYGTNNEFGFDYLRDNLSRDIDECSQTRINFAIIDEVDSILIDEARTPLIISGPVQDSTAKYKKVTQAVKKLKKDVHFTLDEKHKNAVMTEEGIEEIEKAFGLSNVFSVKHMDMAHMALQCIKAMYLYKRDVDYVIKNGEIQIVDEFTGRILEGRRYSDGLHQAIEAVENVAIRQESQTLASVTFQNYFRMFPKLAGMTGTAVTEEAEFGKIYNLEVVVIPTNKPMIRKDLPDIIYKTKEEKYKAIVREVKEKYELGQPVLVGTIAIETSEYISELLKRQGIIHNVLNAKQHEREAEIIANAGQKKAVTIATNMAGRGTDIKLGEGVVELGGLHIIGSERHESRRIDNQLRGRSGRQGDKGSSRFYVSLEDDLMRLFGSDRIAKIMTTLGLPEDTPIEHSLISRSIEKAQTKVEQYHFSIRKQILEYDDVINKQRETIYSLRKQLLTKTNLDAKIKEFIETVTLGIFREFYFDSDILSKNDNYKLFIEQLSSIFTDISIENSIKYFKKKDEVLKALNNAIYEKYKAKKAMYPSQIYEEMLKEIMLMNVDRKWMDHLHNMDVLREGIGLRAWGQKDPLIEYKMEAFDLFTELIESISQETLTMLWRAQIVESNDTSLELKEPIIASDKLEYIRSDKPINQKKQPIKRENKIGRNDPCICGSGRKYKKCCMK